MGERKLDVVRQGVHAVPMKQVWRNGAIPNCREALAHVDDVVVDAEGFLKHDDGAVHRAARNHLVGGNRPI